MPKFADRVIAGRYMESGVWFSRQTIESVLNGDIGEVGGKWT